MAVMPNVDLEFKGMARVDDRVKERIAEVRAHILEAGEKELREYEREPPENLVREYLRSVIRGPLEKMLGIKTFGEVEPDSPLAKALMPHITPIAEKWAAEFFSKPMGKRMLENMQERFMAGFDSHMSAVCYNLGREMGQKYAGRIRYELLGGMDFVEQTEEKIVGG